MMVKESKPEKCVDTNLQVDLVGATVSLNNEKTDSESEAESEYRLPNSVLPCNSNVNIESSSDVVVGTITQFHGPVTIYQNAHNSINNSEYQQKIDSATDDCGSLTSIRNSDAHLVTTDALPRKHQPVAEATCTPKNRKLVLCVTTLTIIIVISVVVSVVTSRVLENKIPEIFDLEENKSSVTASKHLVITRERWGGRPPLYIRPMKVPVKYVIIFHTGGTWCDTIPTCSIQMQVMQTLHVSSLASPDVGYNFVIGGDGNIYVGRGWDAHNFSMKLDTISICFIGNFVYDSLTAAMIEAAHQLLKYGVEHGKLTEDYKIYAHNQTDNTISPGINVYNQIRFWPHFTPEPLLDVN